MKIILVVIISICQALVTSIPVYNKKLSDNRHSFPNNLTTAGKWMLAFIVITILCTLSLYNISENEQAKFQTTLNDTLKRRDVKHEKREDSLSHSYTRQVDSSYKKSSQNFNEVILKYGLHFDSLNNKLVKGMDTMKKQTLIQNISPPELYLDTIKVSLHANNIKRFTFFFKNRKDEAKTVSIIMYRMAISHGEFVKENSTVIDADQITDVKTYSIAVDFFRTDLYDYKSYFYYFDGGYYDKNGKYYSFKSLYEVDGINYKVTQPIGDHKIGLIGLFKKFYAEIKF